MNRIFRCVWKCSTCRSELVFIDNLVAKIVILRELCKLLNRAIARVRRPSVCVASLRFEPETKVGDEVC